MIFILLAHLALLLITKFTAWPEMLLWPYLIDHGWLPYKDIAIAHTPFLFVTTAATFKLIGFGIIQLKIFTWVLILATDIILYFIVRKISGNKTAVLSVLFYAVLSLIYEGNGLWFELALTPILLAVYYFLKEGKYFKAGIFYGLALITKQTSVWFILPIVLTLLAKSKKEKTKIGFLIMGAGTIIAPIILVVFLMLSGIFRDFWFWAVKFGIFYLPHAPGQVEFPSLRQAIVYALPVLPLIFYPELLIWALAGIMGAYPRWGLFHLQPALTFAAISAAYLLTAGNIKASKARNTIQAIYKKYRFYISAGYLILLAFMFLRFNFRNMFKETRFYETDVRNLAQRVDKDTPDNSLIYVVNYWDNLYTLSNTLPATRPWYPYLPWYLKIGGVKDEMLSDLIITMPDEMVVSKLPAYNWEDFDKLLKFYDCSVYNQAVYICRKNK